MKKYKYLFGPVPSRRFGRSLGVDLIPYKTCSMNCVFCQLGKTRDTTITRKEYVPIDLVIEELKHWLKTNQSADYITLSGSGEPTLHSRFGEILEFIGKNTNIPAVLLTNGTMFHLPEVRDAAALADVVKISLSAWNQRSLLRINRPHPHIQFEQLVEGQKEFRNHFKGQLWMEVFLLKDINSAHDKVKKIAALAKKINPDRIQINTAVRPPAEDFAAPLTRKCMLGLTKLFQPPAEVIAEFSTNNKKDIQINQDAIFAMLQRRPCTSQQIAKVFSMHLNEVTKYIGKLMRTGQIHSDRKGINVYYVVTETDTDF